MTASEPDDVDLLLAQLKTLPLIDTADLDAEFAAYDAFELLLGALLRAALVQVPPTERYDNNGELFKRFVVERFPGRGSGNTDYASKLRKFRNAVVKNKQTGPLLVIHKTPGKHWKIEQGMRVLDLQSLVADYREAVDNLAPLLRSSPEMQALASNNNWRNAPSGSSPSPCERSASPRAVRASRFQFRRLGRPHYTFVHGTTPLDARLWTAKTGSMTWRKLLAVVVALTAVLFAFALAAFGRNAASASVTPCSPHVKRGVLPVWMRGGFGPEPRVTHAIGERGAIGAVLWNKPLYSPPAQQVNNKILWVPRHLAKSVAPLWIKMQKMDGTQLIGAPVRRIITTGPGPSLVDAPSAGCWRLTLTWSGQKDTLDLRYVPPTD